MLLYSIERKITSGIKKSLITEYSLQNVSTQTIDCATVTPAIQESTLDTNWEQLLSNLDLLKDSSAVKKERLLNVVKLINYLLSEGTEKNECEKEPEVNKDNNELETPDIEDIENLIDIRMNTEEYDKPNDAENNVSQNKTADFSKTIAKIAAALAKIEDDEKDKGEIENTSPVMGMFRTKNTRQSKINTLGSSTTPQMDQAEVNSVPQTTRFTIPCQLASDILKETSSFVVPKEAYCNLPKNVSLNSKSKAQKSKSENLSAKLAPKSISCVEEEDSFAVLFKPKKITMMQIYGNLLKKISPTILVPYHISKLSL